MAQWKDDIAVEKKTTETMTASISSWGDLESCLRARMRDWIQETLEAEVDGMLKAGFEKEKAAVLVVLGALSDGRKVILAVWAGYRESKQAWGEILRDLKRRGMNCPRLVVGDGHLGIWSALGEIYPEAEAQRCWNHRILNAWDKVPKKLQAQALIYLRRIPYAESRKVAQRRKSEYQGWCRKKGLEAAARALDRAWERMVTCYGFPKEHGQHLRTTNPVELPFSALRLRTEAARRFKKIANALAVIWKMLLVAEKRFRRLNAPELMRDVYEGAKYVDGVKIVDSSEEAVA